MQREVRDDGILVWKSQDADGREQGLGAVYAIV